MANPPNAPDASAPPAHTVSEMMPESGAPSDARHDKDILRREVVSSLNAVARRHGLEVAESGKTARMRDLDDSTGYWSDPTAVTPKPPRWIIHLALADGHVRATVPALPGSRRTGYFNTANRDVGVGCFRIAVAIRFPGETKFHFNAEWDWLLWFAFNPALPNGTSGQLLDDFDPATGALKYMGHPQSYIAAGLVCLSPANQVFKSAGHTLTYQQATDALHRLIHVSPEPPRPTGDEGHDRTTQIPVFDATDTASRRLLTERLDSAFGAAKASIAEPDSEGRAERVRIPVFPELIGLSPSLFRQIEAAINSGKRHLMFYGPPGTGKTTLAQLVAGSLADQWKLITASADWTSQDIIGGYMPLEGGRLAFVPGVLLSHFDKPLIIDELNRCDIDKVIGSLFTVLSGHPTTLPYLTNPADATSSRFAILPEHKPDRASHEFAPSPDWRLIATINTVDKSSLYQMSYALSRRFAWIFVDAPAAPSTFLVDWMRAKGLIPSNAGTPAEIPLGGVWSAVNAVRPLGPAPAIDAVQYMEASADGGGIDHLSPITSPDDARVALLAEALVIFFLPLLDGISRQEGESLTTAIRTVLSLPAEHAIALQLHRSVLAICI